VTGQVTTAKCVFCLSFYSLKFLFIYFNLFVCLFKPLICLFVRLLFYFPYHKYLYISISYYYLVIISLILMVPSQVLFNLILLILFVAHWQIIFFVLSTRIGYKRIFQNIYFRIKGGAPLNESSPMIRYDYACYMIPWLTFRNNLVSEDETFEFSKLR
jgi:hypothetical protein